MFVGNAILTPHELHHYSLFGTQIDKGTVFTQLIETFRKLKLWPPGFDPRWPYLISENLSAIYLFDRNLGLG
jgi:hypothetical protein